MELSDNALAVLTELYKQYLEKEDLDLPDADVIDSTFPETTDVLGKPKPFAVKKALEELKMRGYVEMNIFEEITITSAAISFMDNRYHHQISRVVSFLSSLIPKL